MNITDQTMSDINEICLNDSLNASLLKLKVQMIEDTITTDSNDLIVYVDKTTSNNPTNERKQYVFNLSSSLKYFNSVGDELVQQIRIKNNKVLLETFVNRFVGVNEKGSYILDSSVKEELDNIPITLFEGVNYIYTNYKNANITVIYPKDNEINKAFLNNAIYSEHEKNNKGEFNLDDLYFKDAFTKTNKQLNLEVNHANIDCLTSRNNKFSLDSEGNLVVKTITCEENKNDLNMKNIYNAIYPVGCIYLSISNTSPAILFGGTWEKINGYYLYAGTGGNTTGSNTSGVPSVNTTSSNALNVNQIPSHYHGLRSGAGSNGQIDGIEPEATPTPGYDRYFVKYTGVSNTNGRNITTAYTGGGQGHSHTLSSHTHSVTPLRYEVYMWKRTA